MRRFITYLFAYENGTKTQNIGFVKTDIRNDMCRMSVHVRRSGDQPQKIMICILTQRTPESPLVGIPVAEAGGTQQNMIAEFSFSATNIMDSGISLEDAKGVAVAFSNGAYAASCWSDEAGEDFCMGRYRIYSGEPEDMEEAPKDMPGEPEDMVMAPKVTYEKIGLVDIRRLPKKFWYLSNNSFLIHGYFNYQHLILKTVEENGGKKQYIGVPGIYEVPEKMMAMLFGFPEFESEEAREPESEERVFGYWLCPLHA